MGRIMCAMLSDNQTDFWVYYTLSRCWEMTSFLSILAMNLAKYQAN